MIADFCWKVSVICFEIVLGFLPLGLFFSVIAFILGEHGH